MAAIHKKLPKIKKKVKLHTSYYHYFSCTVLVLNFVVVVMLFQVKSICIHLVCSAHLMDEKI